MGTDYQSHLIKLAKKLNKNNTFSLTKTEKIFKKNGYNLIVKRPYFPDKPIKKHGKKKGSYTISTEINKNTTFSGPVYLPWYFLVAKKNEKKKINLLNF